MDELRLAWAIDRQCHGVDMKRAKKLNAAGILYCLQKKNLNRRLAEISWKDRFLRSGSLLAFTDWMADLRTSYWTTKLFQ